MEDYSELYESEMEYNLLFDNVRGFIARSKFNVNLNRTLRDEPSRFFMYNNGLTITANDIKTEDTNANKKIKIEIIDFQVVNGGQTLRTLHGFKGQDKDNIKAL
jgi:AIPR protein